MTSLNTLSRPSQPFKLRTYEAASISVLLSIGTAIWTVLNSSEVLPTSIHSTIIELIYMVLTSMLTLIGTLDVPAFAAELRNEDLVSGNLGEPLSRPKHIHGTDRDYTVGLNRTNIQFVLEHNIILDRFTLSAGLTAVKNSQADMPMHVYPGVDASYRIGDAWKLYASYNSSLRMPSFTELFYSVGGHKATSISVRKNFLHSRQV